MKCPYCAEEVQDDAIVCKHCGRELFVILPLIAKLAAADRRIHDLEAAASISFDLAPPVGVSPQTAVFPVAARIDRSAPHMPLWLAWTLAYVGLVAAHFLVIVWFDLPLIALRLVSIIVPVLMGFYYRQAKTGRLPLAFFAGIALAAAAILTMSAVIAKVDSVPVLPHDDAGWREYVEYGLSIAFGFFTGVFARHAIVALNAPEEASRPIQTFSRMVAAKFDKTEIRYAENDVTDRRLKRIEAVAMSWLAACSALISITTGLWPFLNR